MPRSNPFQRMLTKKYLQMSKLITAGHGDHSPLAIKRPHTNHATSTTGTTIGFWTISTSRNDCPYPPHRSLRKNRRQLGSARISMPHRSVPYATRINACTEKLSSGCRNGCEANHISIWSSPLSLQHEWSDRSGNMKHSAHPNEAQHQYGQGKSPWEGELEVCRPPSHNQTSVDSWPPMHRHESPQRLHRENKTPG